VNNVFCKFRVRLFGHLDAFINDLICWCNLRNMSPSAIDIPVIFNDLLQGLLLDRLLIAAHKVK
jgi:hypothetical protein